MIPKTIHYCWFGRSEMPQLAKDCIASWHRLMPDWEYRLWNEENFDVDCTPYTSEAYATEKYAFVTDYVRLWALEREGGVYMDTDVEVIKPLDDLLHLTAFTGYEGSKQLPPVTGIMASQAHGIWVTEQLKEYEGRHFILPDGSPDMTTNTQTITIAMKKNGFKSNGELQQYKDLHIFPVEYFCPRQTSGEYLRTEKTYCDHHFTHTWDKQRRRSLLPRLVGQKNITRLIKIKRKLFG